MAVGEDVYCTLVMNDAYLPGAAVLAQSLRDCSTAHKLAVLVTPDTLHPSTLSELRTLYDHVIPVSRLASPNVSNLHLMSRPDLLYTFTKINLWRQTQFRRIVYLDADLVALRAPDELFHLPDTFAAAPDIGWPDAFNTGVMLLAPHMGDYWALQTLADAGASFDGADQGLLNQYFEHKPWKRLSFAYNCTPSANYQYEPAYRYYKHNISLVHFIGKGKPWTTGRKAPVASGAYQELLARWWAVWDRHFGGDVGEYAATGRGGPLLAESRSAERSVEPVASSMPPPPEATVTTTEAPFTEPSDALEDLAQGIVEPTPTIEVRRFSAPQMEWDATRAPPPTTSKPEAANFPSQIYTFNTDPAPFVPPAYPDPPPTHFPIPTSKPKPDEKPPPIFPWEERDVPKPTRTFAPDNPSPADSASTSGTASPPFLGADELEVSADETSETGSSTATPSAPISATPWESFGTQTKNAWDEVQGIDSYVRALSAWQKRRVQGSTTVPPSQQQQHQQQVLSSALEEEQDPVELVERARARRESFVLTDFPSAIERPSLPVTPAPRRRSTFWGADGTEQGELEESWKGAEGVPRQEDWDPNAQLEELRRNSSLLGLTSKDLKLPEQKAIPSRGMPASAGPVEPHATGHAVAGVSDSAAEAGGASQSAARVAFAEPDFGVPVGEAETERGGSVQSGREEALSPTEHGETSYVETVV